MAVDESELEQPTIGRLPIPTRIRLRSTQILTTLPQVVSELLQNSLDAGSRSIEVGVDCEEWTCWIKDDGCGISKAGLELLGSGSEEGRYGTSKAYNSRLSNAASTFGFRGEALASAGDVCCIEIASRTVNSRETWSVISKGGKALYNGPAVRWKRESPGTTVCIRDAFYNLPVRRRSHPSAAKTLETIRREIETYALVFPEVAFTLQNTNTKSEQGASVSRIPKTGSTLSAFRHLYGRALIEHVDEIHSKSGDYQIDGFISLIGAHSKAYQFLYINKHPMSVCELHQTVDSRFNESSFNKNALDEKGDTTLPRSSIRRSPRKTEKKPIYVLNLTLPPDQVDNCLEPSKLSVYVEKSSKVLSFLSSVVQDFLERNRFTSPNVAVPQGQRSTIFASPRKKRKYDFEGDSGYAEDLVPFEIPEEEPIKKSTTTKLLPRGLTRDQDVFWSDDKTGETFVIDPRTGHSYAQKGASTHAEHSAFGYLPGRRTLRPPVEAVNPSGDQIPEWIQTALKSNQVYSGAEKNIRSLCKSLESQHLLEANADRHNCQTTLPKSIWNGDSGSGFMPSTHKLQKADLRSASVVGQIDRKFVACLIRHRPYEDHGDGGDSSDDMKTSLVIVDQHAADERVRVEYFLKELCLGYLHSREGGNDPSEVVQVKRLSPPLPLLLTRDEGRRLKRSTDIQAAFRHWGFHFDFTQSADLDADESPTDSGSAYTQVFLQSIPEMVGEKLLIGEELRDLVKGFIGQVETDLPVFQKEAPESSKRPKDIVEGELRWLQGLRWCPRELVALINSKACRGAIMFNDPLTLDQCERLVQRLSETAFPFQCAHGRPSLIPLLDLTVQEAVFSRDRRKTGRVKWWRLEEEEPVNG
ncbi:hypothetical protein BDN72DRAFT_898304 [Pluteus cervinus]|uniref:Uncharacterized protein n=1 Tax=Pluteus cervinus TaxID=181527 RepID=A0ACD3ARN4_9AGAR|nr:hypothetical protein BDN72DRAFT_898304 [Pluteus cervinus]